MSKEVPGTPLALLFATVRRFVLWRFPTPGSMPKVRLLATPVAALTGRFSFAFDPKQRSLDRARIVTLASGTRQSYLIPKKRMSSRHAIRCASKGRVMVRLMRDDFLGISVASRHD
jgi:hypothetical protein